MLQLCHWQAMLKKVKENKSLNTHLVHTFILLFVILLCCWYITRRVKMLEKKKSLLCLFWHVFSRQFIFSVPWCYSRFEICCHRVESLKLKNFPTKKLYNHKNETPALVTMISLINGLQRSCTLNYKITKLHSKEYK